MKPKLSLSELKDGALWLGQWYTENGYSVNDVLLSQVPRKDNGGVLVYVARERRVGSFQFRHHRPGGGGSGDGPGRTKPEVITRTLGLNVGSHFCMPRERFNRLDHLQLFDDVEMRVDKVVDVDPDSGESLDSEGRPAGVHLTVELFEKPTVEIVPAFSFNLKTGMVGTLSLSDKNFRGRGHRVSLSASRSQSDGYETIIDFDNPRFLSKGKTRYAWTLRSSSLAGGTGASRTKHTGSSVSTTTPLDATGALSLHLGGRAERQWGDETHEPVNQLELSTRIVNDKRKGAEIRTGHRQELGLTRGVNMNWMEGIVNSFWRGFGRIGVMNSFLKGRLGMALGGEIHAQGTTSPGVREHYWHGGEIRGERRSLFVGEDRFWTKTIAELRVPVHERASLFWFAEVASVASGSSVSTVGLGLKFLGTISVVYSVNMDGSWTWKVLPVDPHT
uniref:Bacterial surface antigen (D15) domain-containing protein n=1 Tax=Rhodosorus marinus TaxID=101924 RepID=A0A7S3ACB7_9RHOD|mmetsp:Transcript_9733/g.41712  ORF Transcript_9733/g.41712 Transcript_9733/m.41712 type:complete len:446 (+) Transcript_9733:420-1757(+)